VLRHIVLFRRRQDVGQDDALERTLVAKMTALGSKIPAVRGWLFRANELERSICWDYVLESEVLDADDLNEYLFHPLHQALVVDLKPYFEWAAVDYTA
jgi:hypothetical protein